jgi:microcystin-dependent protein
MPLPTNTSRPSLPYVPLQSLPNNTRYGILTTTQRPPTAEMLDAEFNALTDDVNMLAASINAVQAGSIPGANDPLNANKVLKTDGSNNLSWTYVTNAEIEANAVVEQKLAAQSVTTSKIGDAAVTIQKIAQNAVGTNQLIDACVITGKIADANVTTAKLAHQAVTQTQIANSAVGTNQLIDSNVTTTKIADAAITVAKLDPSIIPPGTINCSAAMHLPAGWLYCDGSAVNRVTYAALFAAIGITYGAGDGNTSFNLPDLRGRMIAGIGNNAGNLDDTAGRVTRVTANAVQLGGHGGNEQHQLTIPEMPAHTHDYLKPTPIPNLTIGGVGTTTVDCNPFVAPTASTGGNQPHNNMSPFLLLKYLIKT